MPECNKFVILNGDTDDVLGSALTPVEDVSRAEACQAAIAALEAAARNTLGPTATLVFKDPRKLTRIEDTGTMRSLTRLKRSLKAIEYTGDHGREEIPVAIKQYEEMRCTGSELRAECARAVGIAGPGGVPDVWPDFCIGQGGDSVYGIQTSTLHDALVAYGDAVRSGTETPAEVLKDLQKPATYYEPTYGDLVRTQARAGKKLLVAVLDGREDKARRKGVARVSVDETGACVVHVMHNTTKREDIPVAPEEVERLKTHATAFDVANRRGDPNPMKTTWGAVFKVGPDLYCAATPELYTALNYPAAASDDDAYNVPIVSGFIGTAKDRYLFERDIFNACVEKYAEGQPRDDFQIVFAPIPDFTIMGAAQHGSLIDALNRMDMGPGDMVYVHCAAGWGRSAQTLFTLFARYAPESRQSAGAAAAFVKAAHEEGEDEIISVIKPKFKMPDDWMFDTAHRALKGDRPERPVFFAAFADA